MQRAVELYDEIKTRVDVQIERLSELPDSCYTTWGKVKADEIQEALDRLHRTVLIKTAPEGSDQGLRTTLYGRERKEIYLQFFGPNYIHQPISVVRRISPGDIEARSVQDADISSIQSMLDIQLRYWRDAEPDEIIGGQEYRGHDEGFISHPSLRNALNIARNNFFSSRVHGFCGPLWGKTTALKEVEEALAIINPPGRR